jgi:hypothetical protein
MSPAIHRESGYTFYFVSFDIASGEPPHVHVGKGRAQPRGDAKFWLDPVSLADSGRFSHREVQRMLHIVQEQQAHFLEEWHDYRNRI